MTTTTDAATNDILSTVRQEEPTMKRLRWEYLGVAPYGNAYGPILLYGARLSDGSRVRKQVECSREYGPYRTTYYIHRNTYYRRLTDVLRAAYAGERVARQGGTGLDSGPKLK